MLDKPEDSGLYQIEYRTGATGVMLWDAPFSDLFDLRTQSRYTWSPDIIRWTRLELSDGEGNIVKPF